VYAHSNKRYTHLVVLSGLHIVNFRMVNDGGMSFFLHETPRSLIYDKP